MKVILSQDVKGQGKKGQLVDVSDGYARNYLLPRKLAIEASAANLNVMKSQEAAKQHKIDSERAAALAAAEKLKGTTVKVYVKSGAGGKLFGSVTPKEISEALKAQHDLDIDKHKLVLDEPIKQFGTYEIKVKLFPEISGTIYIVVAEAV